MSLLLPPRDGSKWSKNDTLPLVQSVPNPYQGRTIVMTSETSKKLLFFYPNKGWHGTGAATRRTDFDILIVRTGAAGGSIRVIMRLLMNSRRRKKKGANGPHTDEHARAHINTDAKTGAHAQWAERSPYTVCV